MYTHEPIEKILKDKIILDISPLYKQLHLFALEPGYFLERHSHAFYHVNMVLQGQVEVVLDDRVLEIQSGHIFVIPPDLPHAIETRNGYSQIGVDVRQVDDENGMFHLFRESISGVKEVTVVAIMESLQKYENLDRFYLHLTELNRLQVIHMIDSILLMLIDHLHGKTNVDFRESFLDLMSQPNAYAMELQDICRAMGLSRTHLERLVKKEFDCGAIEYANKIRLLKACQYLENTNVPIRELSENLNFYDESHFIKFFKKQKGVTPFQYRRGRKLSTKSRTGG